MAIKALLYSADAPDQQPDIASLEAASLSARQLLWIDLISPTAAEIDQVAELLSCDRGMLTVESASGSRPDLANYGDVFRVTVRSVSLERASKPLETEPLTLVAGLNYVVTLHGDGVTFLDGLRTREKGESAIGALSAESFVASQLDWMLDTYFKALEVLIRDIDRVEVAILGKKMPPEFLKVLIAARKRIAELRRLLKSHRDVFYGLARPDFTATEHPEAKPHFEALNKHFERAEDDLESARDLVIGSFDLLSTLAAQRTNETMRVLTFVTVLMGTLALVAGLMGMNFELPFFQTGALGFYVVTGIMALFSGLAVIIAIRRSWI